jgi:hypothetical protein
MVMRGTRKPFTDIWQWEFSGRCYVIGRLEEWDAVDWGVKVF